jgi:NTP pyrophosphatase (non-canonical NTP hydrolase)
MGDLLLQIVFLSRIAEEKRAFDFSGSFTRLPKS